MDNYIIDLYLNAADEPNPSYSDENLKDTLKYNTNVIKHILEKHLSIYEYALNVNMIDVQHGICYITLEIKAKLSIEEFMDLDKLIPQYDYKVIYTVGGDRLFTLGKCKDYFIEYL